MRKFVLTCAILCMLSYNAIAGQVLKTVIPATDLTKSSSETTVTLATKGMQRMTVFFDYEQNGTCTFDITLDVSYDGTNWLDANFFDYTASAVPTWQDTEQINSDTWYYLYWENELAVPYVRIHTIGNTWSDTSTATITVYTVTEY